MKRLMVLGVFFCAAAAMGFGLNLLTASTAAADICDSYDLQYYWDCEDAACTDPALPVGAYICGTRWPSGYPCECEFIACQLKCPQIIPRL